MKFAQLSEEGYEGIDFDLETSLYEYGLVWKCIDEDRKEYKFYYGVGMTTNEQGEAEYNRFDWGTMTEADFLDMLTEDWFLKKSFDECRGKTEVHFPNDMYDALNYHGYENVLGSSYDPISIEKDEG